MLFNLLKYFYAIFFQHVGYRLFKVSQLVRTKLFFGAAFYVRLPAGTDIFITGGKSDDSEIRLTKFLIKNLNEGDRFADIGSHFGYFSVLAAACVGEMGKVYSFEGSPQNFEILKLNAGNKENIILNNLIVTYSNRQVVIYEFDIAHSEFNSLYPDQYVNQKWYANAEHQITKVQSVALDNFLAKERATPKIIKIDVEGAEHDVLGGATKTLSSQDIHVIVEYLSERRGNKNHKKAVQLLKELGYKSFRIDQEGKAVAVEDIDQYFHVNGLDSDNLLFKK